MNELEKHSALYWALCRRLRCNRWNGAATAAMTRLLQSPYERVRLAACDLWYRVSSNADENEACD